MIKHVVIFQFEKEKINNSIILNIVADLKALPNAIPELISMEVGLNINPKEKQDLVLTATLNNLNDLEKYDRNPAHQAVASKIKAIAISRTCVDHQV